MDDEFFKCVKENSVLIKISKYPNINENVYPLKKMDLIGIKYFIQKFDNFYVKFSEREENAEESYYNCIVPIALYLDKGKIYQCPYIMNIKYYDKKFNINWEKDTSYIDLYSNTANEILDQIMKAPVFCKHCKVQTGFVNCEQTNPKKEDWNLEDNNDKLVKKLDYYDYLSKFKAISFGMIRIQNNLFEIIKVQAVNLKNMNVTVIKCNEKDTVFMELVTKAADIIGFSIDNIITLEELDRIPKNIECNYLYKRPTNHLLNIYGHQDNLIIRKLFYNKFIINRRVNEKEIE